MRRIFADTFFYLALLNRRDAAHHSAMRFVAGGNMEIFTTTAILLEVGDAFSSLMNRRICGEFLARFSSQPYTTVRQLDQSLFTRGLELYRNRPDKAWSLTDCLSFVVMSDDGLTEALTGDKHFEQAGFRALLLQ